MQRSRAPQPLKFPLLEYPKQFRLELKRNLADLIQECSAMVRNFEPAEICKP
jgi:hypothetical protein